MFFRKRKENSSKELLYKISTLAEEINQTADPASFFNRYDELYACIKEYDKYKKNSAIKSEGLPNNVTRLTAFRNKAVHDFIERCYQAVVRDIEDNGDIISASKSRGRFEAIRNYYDALSDENRFFYDFRLRDIEYVASKLINKLSVDFDSLGGEEFEKFCAELIKRNGFSKVEARGAAGDNGVDILAEKDGVTYAIQCKRYASNIGNGAVQEIYAGKEFFKRHVGVVMTNQYFTPSAKETAERTGVILWDRDYITRLLAQS